MDGRTDPTRGARARLNETDATCVAQGMDTIAPILFAVVAVAISVGLTVLWVSCLIDAAKEERWGWFVLMLLVSFTALLYFFMEYESPTQRRQQRERRRRREARRAPPTRAEIDDLRAEVRRLRAERRAEA